MIFATIGTQAPFDRFVRALDEISAEIPEEVICQTIPSKKSYQPVHMRAVGFLGPDEFDRYFRQARLVVAHAGMGTVLQALAEKKPLIIFPRHASLHEHRNDHQISTAKKMRELGLVHVADDEVQLRELVMQKDIRPLAQISPWASDELLNAIKKIVDP